MRKGISIWSMDPNLSLKENFSVAKETGFEGVEVALDESGELNLDSTDEDTQRIREQAQEVGIEITSLACGLFWKYSLTSDDESTRQKAMEVLEKLIQLAAALGVDGTLVIPGAVYVSWEPSTPVVPYEKVYQRSQEALRKAAPLAEEKQVYLGVENVWNGFLLSPIEMARFVDEIGNPYVGVYFDVGNVVNFGYPEHWIEILGERIKRVHFKDFRRAAGGMAGFVDLLSGDVNWPAVMSAFKKVGYDGWAVAEMGKYTYYPDQMLRNTSQAMDRIFRGA